MSTYFFEIKVCACEFEKTNLLMLIGIISTLINEIVWNKKFVTILMFYDFI